MHLELQADTSWQGKFKGDLHFSALGRKITVEYFLGDGQPKKSLGIGDEVDITFKIGEAELPVKGIFPGVIESVPARAQCLWVLSSQLIYSNIFIIMAGTEGKSTDISAASQSMSGEVNEQTIRVLFDGLP